MADRILMLILDGIGDRVVKELDDRTPLETADTPNLDEFARKGVNGIMDTIAPGIRPGSDTGHLALLGYDPYEVYTGRGPFEAAGAGIELEPDDVAFRTNFATLKDGRIVNRRAGRIKGGQEELSKALQDVELEVDFQFEATVEHRGVLVLKGEDLGGDVTDIDPHGANERINESTPVEDSEENRRTAEIINDFTQKSIEVLSDHPVNQQRAKEEKPQANVVLPRGGGKVPDLEDIESLQGLDSAAISGITLVRGVCCLAGMDIIDVEGATGGLDTDLEAIMNETVESLKNYEFVLVNIKGCDLSGHDGLSEQKIDFIEKIDEHLEALKGLEDTYIAITGDHSTAVTIEDHSGDPLPLTILGDDVRTDDVEKFSERACALGGLNRINGMDVLNILKDLADRTEKFGA